MTKIMAFYFLLKVQYRYNKMLELKLRTETISVANNSKLISEFMSCSGIVDKTSDSKHRIYFMCAIERPVRWFTISQKKMPSYITCNMFINGIHIVCKPLNENLIFTVLSKKANDNKKLVTMTGYATNSEHPKNEQPIEVQLIVDKEKDVEGIEVFFVERVQFYIEVPTVNPVADYVELDTPHEADPSI